MTAGNTLVGTPCGYPLNTFGDFEKHGMELSETLYDCYDGIIKEEKTKNFFYPVVSVPSCSVIWNALFIMCRTLKLSRWRKTAAPISKDFMMT